MREAARRPPLSEPSPPRASSIATLPNKPEQREGTNGETEFTSPESLDVSPLSKVESTKSKALSKHISPTIRKATDDDTSPTPQRVSFRNPRRADGRHTTPKEPRPTHRRHHPSHPLAQRTVQRPKRTRRTHLRRNQRGWRGTWRETRHNGPQVTGGRLVRGFEAGRKARCVYCCLVEPHGASSVF